MILFSIQYHEVIFQYEVASLCKIALIFHIAKFFHLLTDVEIWWCSTSQVALVLLSQITFVPMPKFCKDIQIEGKTTSKQSRWNFGNSIEMPWILWQNMMMNPLQILRWNRNFRNRVVKWDSKSPSKFELKSNFLKQWRNVNFSHWAYTHY